MPLQWTFKDINQAQQEFLKKEKLLSIGVLVLINQIIYHFEDKKTWEGQQTELLKGGYGNYAWTNLAAWHEWLRQRG